MKLLTYLIYTLLITCMLACGGSKYKNKYELREKRIEIRDSLKTLHPDSIVKYRDKRVAMKKKKKKNCCAKCGCEINDNN